MQDVIEEYSVHVLKKFGSKEVKVRVLLIENVPHVRLVNPGNKIEDIDISSVAKTFIKFNSNNYKRSIKLILKKRQLTFFFNDLKIFSECRKCIDNALLTYHQDGHATNNLTFNGEFIQLDVNSETSSNDDCNSDPIQIFRRPSVADTDEYIFKMDYTTSDFCLNSPSMKGGYTNLETSPFRNKNTVRDTNIFVAMKIREEACNPGGIKVSISKKFIENIIVTNFDNKLWISDITAWDNIKGILHIGDRVIAINDTPVSDIHSFYLTAINCEECSLTLQRIPNGRVFAFDKKKSDLKMIRLDKKKFFLKPSERSRDMEWQISEINRMNTLNINEENIISNIQSIINSNFSFLALVIHPTKFIKSLTEHSSPRSPY